MTVLRGICIAAATAAFAAAVAIGEPRVDALLAPCALVLFVVGAGSIAADAFPLRHRLALVCSALTPVAGLWLGVGGFAGLPPVVAAVPGLLVTLVPVVYRPKT